MGLLTAEFNVFLRSKAAEKRTLIHPRWESISKFTKISNLQRLKSYQTLTRSTRLIQSAPNRPLTILTIPMIRLTEIGFHPSSESKTQRSVFLLFMILSHLRILLSISTATRASLKPTTARRQQQLILRHPVSLQINQHFLIFSQFQTLELISTFGQTATGPNLK